MSDLFNGWPEDGEPVLTMSDEEVVRWLNKTQDTIVEQAAKITRLQAVVDAAALYVDSLENGKNAEAMNLRLQSLAQALAAQDDDDE